MADKPLQYPDFALNDELDPITLAPNKVEPTDEFKLSGQKRRQPLPRPYLNWQLNNIGKWIRWVEEQLLGSPSATLESAYPVGHVLFTVNPANPASYFGFGTWVAIGQGRTIVGVNTGDPDFNTVLKTGGSKTHTHGGVTGNTTLTIAQIPAHNHTLTGQLLSGSGDTEGSSGRYDASGTDSTSIQDEGGGLPHNHTISSASNVQPYLTLYIWQRVS